MFVERQCLILFLLFCSAYLCCTKCRYSSCCSRALSIHVQLFHGPKTPQFTLGHPSMLPNEVFCVCGFSTKSGNKMGMSKLKSTENFKSKSTQNPEQHRIISESSFLASSVMLTPMIWSSCLSRQRTPLLLKQAEGGSSITYGSSSRNETLTNRFSGMPSGGLRAFPGQTISLMSIFPMDTKVIISKNSISSYYRGANVTEKYSRFLCTY